MANWQTATANLFARLTVKQLIKRQHSVEYLRSAVAPIERLFPSRPAGCEIDSDPPLPHCEAEWVRLERMRTDRVVLHFPGGAYVLRMRKLERSMLAAIAKAAHASARIVFYRLAPEHPFPAGHDDCVGAYRQLLDTGIRADRIVLSGISAGGGMALAVLLAIRERGWPLPAGVVAMSPLTDLTDPHDGSRTHNAPRDSVLSSERGADMRAMYVGGNLKLLTHPYVSPMFGDFAGMPPVLFQVGNREILLDDSRRCAQRIREAGATAEVEVWDDVPHGWQALPFIPESRAAVERIADFIRMHAP